MLGVLHIGFLVFSTMIFFEREKILGIATSMGHSAMIRNSEVHVQADADWAATLNKAAFDAGITLAQLTPQLPNLEETFFEMTGDRS